MDIKKEIGQRIHEARKGKGLTRKALADLTDDLKPSRISNWEYGIRTPGPEEVKQLSKALEVSPAFLMCLTEKMNDQNPNWGILIPILDSKQACDPMAAFQSIQQEREDIVTYVPFSFELTTQVGEHVFALKMPDDSMEPELRRHDILFIDPDKMPIPGSFVVAKVENTPEVIVRRYKQLCVSQNIQEFELLALNKHWADIREKCTLVGTVCGLQRALL